MNNSCSISPASELCLHSCSYAAGSSCCRAATTNTLRTAGSCFRISTRNSLCRCSPLARQLSFGSSTAVLSLIPVRGLLSCCYLLTGMEASNWAWFFGWLLIGLVVYFLYGYRNSKIGMEKKAEHVKTEDHR